MVLLEREASRAVNRLVVSTVGTSLLTNGADPTLLPLLRRTANLRPGELAPAARGRLDSLFDNRRRVLERAGPVEVRRLSAELNGLLAIPDVLEGESFAPSSHHVLIATDTAQGRAVASMVHDWIAARDGTVEILQVPDLRTDALASFRVALSDLARLLIERTAGTNVLLNLTGGFKSVNAYLQALAMLQGWESVFLFEGARELLRIPRLPLTWRVDTALEPHLQRLRRLKASEKLALTELAGVPDSLLFVLGDEATLSEWGAILLEEASRKLYRERLQPPAVPELVFADTFPRAVAKLAPDDLAKLNRQLDRLARWVVTNGRVNPASLDVKKLRGDPQPPATHEVDAWTGSAKRLFGHFEDGKFVIDHLGDHL